jgi:beta-glucosidase
MAERVTIRDIARMAGVSVGTVSRVLNHKPDVDPATRERIRACIAQTGYQPAHAAVVLARSATHKHPSTQTFPVDFLWGVGTSALQIEGALAADGRGPSIWDDVIARPPPDFAPHTPAVACDHYHRMDEDVALLAQLGVNAYRFSIAWPRVLPDGEGQINAAGLDFYDRLVDRLLAAGITPLATLYHWDLPLALQQRYGGWLDRRTAYAFADYAALVARRLGDRIRWWMTLNEPWSIVVLGYLRGEHPPYRTDPVQALQAAHHLLVAHGLAVPRLRAICAPGTAIGISLNLSPIYPADQREATQRAAQHADLWHNCWLLDPLFRGAYPAEMAQQGAVSQAIASDDMACIATPLDFVGISYYSRLVVRPSARAADGPLTGFEQVVPVPEASYSQMGWEIYAAGLSDLLLRLHRDYHPPALVVTENGVAFDDGAALGGEHIQDRRRIDFLREHINAMHTAYQLGVSLRGYCAWTFMDNFEWMDGYHQQFGMVAVNRTTQQRTIKESGRWYAHYIATQRGGDAVARLSDT